MSPPLVVRALTSNVAVLFDESVPDADRAVIAAPWAPLRTEGTADSTVLLRRSTGASDPVAEGIDAVVTADTAEQLADRLTTQVTLAALRGMRGRALLLHASAVAVDDGRVVAFVGPSGRGKTTAVRALCASYGYVTDETLAVLPDLTVVPYPKPLSIVSGGRSKQQRSADELGLKTRLPERMHLSALVLLDRRHDVVEPAIGDVPADVAIPELAAQSSYLADLEDPVPTLARLVSALGGVRRLAYSEAATLIRSVPLLLDSSPRDAAPLEIVRADVAGATPAPRPEVPEGEEPVYRRADFVDAAHIDGSLFVLRPGEIVVLDGLGPVLWAAAENSSRDDLLAIALRELDEPPVGTDPVDVVDAAIQALTDARVLLPG